MNAPAPIGHNMPADPHAAMQIHVEALFETAQGFLDGEPITTQEAADTVGLLIDEARKAGKDADQLRTAEKKPHDDAAKAVQAKWKPLVDRCTLVADTAKRALVPFLAAKEAERIERERVAREEANKLAEQARQRLDMAGTDITARADAEDALKAAEKADKDANRIAKEKAHASGGGRAIGLRTVYVPVLVDPMAALKHYMSVQGDLLKDWLRDQAEKDCSAGQRAIPGFRIDEDRRAQ